MLGQKIKQEYVHFEKWEDWLNGMWRTVGKSDELNMLEIAIEFTGDWERYGEAMRSVSKAWPNTMLNSLTNPGINRRAFLGHCAVCYKLEIPEYITRMAWKQLSDEQREKADRVAQETIDNWIREKQTKRIHKDVGEQMLLKWPA